MSDVVGTKAKQFLRYSTGEENIMETSCLAKVVCFDIVGCRIWRLESCKCSQCVCLFIWPHGLERGTFVLVVKLCGRSDIPIPAVALE